MFTISGDAADEYRTQGRDKPARTTRGTLEIALAAKDGKVKYISMTTADTDVERVVFDLFGDDMGLSLDGMAVTLHPSQAGTSEQSTHIQVKVGMTEPPRSE